MSEEIKGDVAGVIAAHLADGDFMVKEAEKEFPEVFVKGSVFIPDLAEAVKAVARRIDNNLTLGERGLLLWASFYIAKQAGWTPKKEGK